MIDQLSGLPGFAFTELQHHLSDLYAPCCDHGTLPNLADAGDDLEATLADMILSVWKGKGMPEKINPAMTRHFSDVLWNGITTGYGEDLLSVDFDTPDYLMLRKLQESVFHFSAAKNYQQLKDLSNALVDDKGKLRSFRDFKEAANAINDQHVNKWLKAEYEMAIASSQMAATWTRFEENKDIMPLLKFDAVNDNRTSAVCKSLDGVIRPIDDAFWSIYYPPNHWGCRSDVQQVLNGKITPAESIVTPENMPDMFKTNMAQNGVAFPKGHPYFTGLPNHVEEQAAKLLTEFKPAATLKEAEAFALSNGLARNVSYKGLKHVEVANDVNQVLLELKQETGITFDAIAAKTESKKGKATYIMADELRLRQQNGKIASEHHTLLINKAHFNKFEKYQDAIDSQVASRNRKWTTAEDVKGVVWHEVGHRLTSANVHSDYRSRYESLVHDTDRLGRYAQKNLDETLAEIFCYFKKTGNIDPAWKELFNKWSHYKIK